MSKEEMTEQDALERVRLAREKRQQVFSEALQALLKEHNCDLVPVITITGTKVQAAIQIVVN